MTVEQLIDACVNLSVNYGGFTTKDGQHDLTNAVLELQVCLQEMGKRELKKVAKAIEEI